MDYLDPAMAGFWPFRTLSFGNCGSTVFDELGVMKFFEQFLAVGAPNSYR